jgi:hypothetical protein
MRPTPFYLKLEIRGLTLMKSFKTAGTILLGTCLSASFGAVSAAEAVAKLSRFEGMAFVSQGAQYLKGREGMPLYEGNRIMVLEGGTATLSFSDGCRYTLEDNELLTLGPASTCASDAVGSYKIDPYSGVSQSSGSYQQAALQPPTQPTDPYPITPAAGGPAWVPWVAGAAVVGGVIWAANDDDDGGSTGPGRITTLPISP